MSCKIFISFCSTKFIKKLYTKVQERYKFKIAPRLLPGLRGGYYQGLHFENNHSI